VEVVSLAGDITVESVREGLVARTLEAFGMIEILVNNAGIEPLVAFDTQTVAEIVRAIELNYIATVLLTHQVLPHMLAKGRGHIVAVSSTMGPKGQPYAPPTYSGTKAAQVKWAEAVRAELRGSGVGVSAVCPGIVAGAGIVGELTKVTGASHRARRPSLPTRLRARS
jgi:short-subunit dehydrogenase